MNSISSSNKSKIQSLRVNVGSPPIEKKKNKNSTFSNRSNSNQNTPSKNKGINKNKLFVASTSTPPINGTGIGNISDVSDDSDSNENVFQHLGIASPLVRRAHAQSHTKKLSCNHNHYTNDDITRRLANSPLTLKLSNNGSNRSTKSNGIEDVKRVSLSTIGNNINNNTIGNNNGGMSNSWGWAAPRDSAFEEIIHILMRAPFTHIFIGEECGSWSWQTLMFVFEKFSKMSHLNINVCGFESTLPNIESESEYQVFINSTSHFINNLMSLSCNDDALLRAISSLAKNRKKAIRINDNNSNSNGSKVCRERHKTKRKQQ